MKSEDIIVFTSSAGQYYHIEAVARVIKDFTTDAENIYYNSDCKVIETIEWLVDKGYIANVNFNEFNVDRTRNKVSHIPASSCKFMRPRILNYAYNNTGVIKE